MHISNVPSLEGHKRLKCKVCGMPSEIVERDPLTRDSLWRCTHCYTGYQIAWQAWENMTDQDFIFLPTS